MLKGFSILEYQGVRDGLMDYRKKGALRGVFLGFPVLHQNYTMSLPGVTDVTGSPGSGKSEFILELLLNTALYYGWKHLLYVPDVGDKNEVLATLIHKLTGKSFESRFENYITEQEVEKELQWIFAHFFILVKDDLKSKITPYEFWEYAAHLKKEHGVKTATIDSWKDMEHDRDRKFGRDDKYLEDVLSYRNAMAEAHKMHFITIIHPLKTEKDSAGKRKPPTMYDLKGGTEWANSGKVMMTVHRTDGSPNAVDVIITKAKPKSVAKLGVVPMFFDVAKAKFYWDYDGAKTYASKNNVELDAAKIQLNDDNDLPF